VTFSRDVRGEGEGEVEVWYHEEVSDGGNQDVARIRRRMRAFEGKEFVFLVPFPARESGCGIEMECSSSYSTPANVLALLLPTMFCVVEGGLKLEEHLSRVLVMKGMRCLVVSRLSASPIMKGPVQQNNPLVVPQRQLDATWLAVGRGCWSLSECEGRERKFEPWLRRCCLRKETILSDETREMGAL